MLLLLSVLTSINLAAARQSIFTVPHTDGADDALGFAAAVQNYSTNSTILFKEGVTYNIYSPIKFPTLSNVEIRIEGNLSYPSDIATVQEAVSSSDFPGAWLTFTGGTNVTLRGSADPSWGWIDGHGQTWWDVQNQTNRPHGIAFSKIAGGVIRDIKIWKPIAWNFATSGSSDIHVFNNKILAISDNVTTSFPFNTDGFSAGGTDMLFEDNYVVNGDDCLTVGSGAKNIVFRNSYCRSLGKKDSLFASDLLLGEGGHGLSIGSLGEGGSVADVENVLIENNFMKNTLYGARFKSWTGGNGLAQNQNSITWRNIEFDNVRFPVYVTQNYWDQELGPAPNPVNANNTHIRNFLFQNFVGTIDDQPNFFEGSCVSDPCWYAVEGATGKEVIILDLYPNTTSNVLTKDVFAKTETGAAVAVMCNPDTISNDVGFVCQDGAFIRTAAGI
ncbi:hypothetical protein M0805_003778 [Coniferiporia weirii]|nr:hypothetical protein M0805_003778 [Coniferiporia weirii]